MTARPDWDDQFRETEDERNARLRARRLGTGPGSAGAGKLTFEPQPLLSDNHGAYLPSRLGGDSDTAILCDWCCQPPAIRERVLSALSNLIDAVQQQEADGEFGISWLTGEALQDAKTAYAAALTPTPPPGDSPCKV